MKLLSFFSVFQVRVDSGIQPGSDISIYYDPMISKVSSIFYGFFQFYSEGQQTYLINKFEIGSLSESGIIIKQGLVY